MGIRRDLPTLPTNKPSTLLNLDAGVGFYVGSFLSALGVMGMLVVGAPAMAAAVVGYGVWGASTLVGAFNGKKRMDEDNTYGRPVCEPAVFNKGTVGGIVLSNLALMGAGMALSVFGLAIPSILSLGIIVGAMAGGSLMRYNDMKQDVAQGEYLKASSVIGHAASKYHNSVAAEQAQQLEARMRNGNGQSFGDRVAESRANAQQQAI